MLLAGVTVSHVDASPANSHWCCCHFFKGNMNSVQDRSNVCSSSWSFPVDEMVPVWHLPGDFLHFHSSLLFTRDSVGLFFCSASPSSRRLKLIKKIKKSLTLSNSLHDAALTCVQGLIFQRWGVKKSSGRYFHGAEVMMDDAPVFLKGSTLYRLPPLYFSSLATRPAVINHQPRKNRNVPIYLSAYRLTPSHFSCLSGLHPSVMS